MMRNEEKLPHEVLLGCMPEKNPVGVAEQKP
jgi:hypothetical protein